MSSVGEWLRDQRVPVVLILAGAGWIGWLLAVNCEISVWGDLRRDVVLRDAYSPEMINDIRFYDSSPYAIWMPSDLFVRDSVRNVELPWWDRKQAGGYSPVLNLQNGVFHPIRWVAAMFPRPFATTAILIISLTTLAVGVFAMLRRVYEVSEPGALLGATAVVGSGFILSVAQFSGMLVPLVHTPWLVWSFFAWSEKRSLSTAQVFSLTVALLVLAGHPLIIGVVVVVAAGLIAWKALVGPSGWRALLWGSCLGLLGVLMTAAVTLPMIMGLGRLWSYKNTTPEGFSYVLPKGLGAVDALLAAFTYHAYGDLIDGGTFAFHLGPLAVVLALLGAAEAARRRSNRIVVVMIVVGWLLAAPPSWVAAIVGRTPISYYKPWYLMMLMVLPVGIAVSLGFDRLSAVAWTALRPALALGAIVGVALPILVPARVVFCAYPMVEPDSPATRFLKNNHDAFRVVGLSGQTHVPNVAATTGIEDVRFSSPVHAERYTTWIGVAAPDWAGDFPVSTIIHDANSSLLRAFNVRFVLRSAVPGHDIQTFLPRPGQKPPKDYFIDPEPEAADFARVFGGGSVEVYEAARGLHPRAHFAEQFVVVDNDLRKAAAALANSGRSGATTEVVELGPEKAGLLDGIAPPSPGDQVRLSYPSSDTVSLETRTKGRRLLVLHDSWDPGWRAKVDGRAVEVLPVSVLSRGVVVPGGEHRVTMRFVPKGAEVGLAISVAAFAGCVVLARRLREGGAKG